MMSGNFCIPHCTVSQRSPHARTTNEFLTVEHFFLDSINSAVVPKACGRSALLFSFQGFLRTGETYFSLTTNGHCAAECPAKLDKHRGQDKK
jgi:hypothetical protein